MRITTCLVMLVSVAVAGASVADETKGPYARVVRAKTPADEKVKVYTNADLEKMFGIAAAQDRAQPAEGEAAGVGARTDENDRPKDGSDPLTWLQKRQEAQRQHAAALQAAETTLAAAQAKVAGLERQQLAVRNPFSARPELSEDEKALRGKGGETATQRYERTTRLLQEAREEVRVAAAELARLRAQGP